MSETDGKTRAVALAMNTAEVCVFCDDALSPDVGALVVCSVKGDARAVLPVVNGLCFRCYRAKPERLHGLARIAGVDRE